MLNETESFGSSRCSVYTDITEYRHKQLATQRAFVYFHVANGRLY